MNMERAFLHLPNKDIPKNYAQSQVFQVKQDFISLSVEIDHISPRRLIMSDDYWHVCLEKENSNSDELQL